MRAISPLTLEKLVSGKRVLIDSNIVIYLMEDIDRYADLSRLLFSLIEEGRTQAFISAVSIAEVMQGPLRKGLIDTAVTVKKYLLNFPNMLCQIIDMDVLEKVGYDKKILWSKLRAADSLIIASGLYNHVDSIVSNDRHFRQAISKDLLVSFEKL